MADKSTYIKLDRNILKWRWFTDGNTLKVWIWLLANANIKDHDFLGDTIRRGQTVASYPRIATDTHMTERQARTALEHLKMTGEVTVRRKSRYQVITIVNYDLYQSDKSVNKSGRSQSDVNQKSGRSQSDVSTIRKIRTTNVEEGKNVCVAHTPDPAEVAGFFRERGRSSQDADKFFAYNNARGWKIGRKLIEDWRSAAEIWMAQAEDVGGRNRDEDDGLDEWGKPIRKEFQ